MGDIARFLEQRTERALARGSGRRLVVDPGIEFGKLLYQDLELLRRLPELGVLGYPVLVAVSRKHFIGNVLGLPRTTAWKGRRQRWPSPSSVGRTWCGARRAGDGVMDAEALGIAEGTRWRGAGARMHGGVVRSPGPKTGFDGAPPRGLGGGLRTWDGRASKGLGPGRGAGWG